MCYSAQVWENYRSYVRAYGADVSISEFVELYVKRAQLGGTAVKIPKGMDVPFLSPQSPQEAEIQALITAFNESEISKAEQELFKQRKRVADAERILQSKTTKKAQEDVRIGTEKVDKLLVKLGDIKRNDAKPRDSRIFPGGFAPVLVVENGQRVVKPMRYQCRPHGKPAANDIKFPGTYNARRDSLEGYWSGLFGRSHAVIVAERFYENVERVDEQGNPYNAVLEFAPRSEEPMLIACLWSRWVDPSGKEPPLLSFAAITDDPEPEVLAAGHDRTIINIKPEHLDAWLNPVPGNLDALYAIFDDKQHPYYEHRVAAAA